MQFELYRISLVVVDVNLFTKELDQAGRRVAAKECILARPQGVHWNTTYRLSNIEEVELAGDEVLIGVIARPESAQLAVRDPHSGDIVDESIDTQQWTAFIYFVSDQVIAVRRNQSFFSGQQHGYVRLLESVLNGAQVADGYQIVVRPLNEPASFADALERCAQVSMIRFEMIPPNAFGAGTSLKKLLEAAKTHTNATKLVQQVENKESGLQQDGIKSEFGEEIAYTGAGGGHWRVRGRSQDGKKVWVRSDQRIATAGVDIEPKSLSELRQFAEAITAAIRVVVDRITSLVQKD